MLALVGMDTTDEGGVRLMFDGGSEIELSGRQYMHMQLLRMRGPQCPRRAAQRERERIEHPGRVSCFHRCEQCPEVDWHDLAKQAAETAILEGRPFLSGPCQYVQPSLAGPPQMVEFPSESKPGFWTRFWRRLAEPQ